MKTNLYTVLQRPEQYLRLLGRRAVFKEVIYPNEIARQYELTTPENIQETLEAFLLVDSISMVSMGDIDSETILQTMSEIGV